MRASFAEPLFHLASYDVSPLLPPDWQEQALRTAREGQPVRSDAIELDHDVPDRRPLRYRVSTGVQIQSELPWLWRLYNRDFLRLASSFAGEAVEVAADAESTINLNLLSGESDSYEWHVDSNPVTGLLFVTNHDPSAGGQLRFRSPELGVLAEMHPRAGQLLIFDARRMPHAVEKLTDGGERLTAPMNYYRQSLGQKRPKGLDSHIYGAKPDDQAAPTEIGL